MARYVVVEFLDNEQADEFVQQLARSNEIDRQNRLTFSRRVVGIFVKPGRVCECAQWRAMNSGQKDLGMGKTIARGAKFGWWVCGICNRPRRGSHQLVNQQLLSQTYEGPTQHELETQVDGLNITGIHTKQLSRPKRLRRKKPKGA